MGEAFYLEIGTEEIPAGYIMAALEAMSAQMVRFLDENRIHRGEPTITGTACRLVLHLPGVAPHQQASTTEIIGPPKRAAFDAQGRPTKAAEGFAKGQGVRIEDLRIKQTPKGEYLCVFREESGAPTRELLEKMLPDFIARIPFPKSMRWGSLSVTFARPVRFVVAMLGNRVLEFEYGDVRSGGKSLGHRFMSPKWIEFSDYASHLRNLKENFVIADIDERRRLVLEGARKAAQSVNGKILEDEELLEEVTQLVEFPQPLVGKFEQKYLELPPELLITVIKKHQRYFAVTGEDGKLLPYFVTIANTIPRNFALVAAGNARVVRARLEDARFYYIEDQKVSLDARAEQLKGVVFHSKMGTSWEKMERFSHLARWIARRTAPERTDAVMRAARLCKADLVTGVVGEFPDLQGVMGRAYARLQGEPEPVVRAIYEHYLPNRAGGPIPEGIEGAVISIADKMDTIVACFGVGLIPTGTADPFALRRQTLGIIRIILEKSLPVPLGALIDEALPQLASKLTEPAARVKESVIEFFQARLHHMLVQEGYGPDLVDAALSAGMDDLNDAAARAKALAAFKARPDFESLATAFKRVANIIKEPEPTPVDPKLLEDPAEQALFTALRDVEGMAEDALARADYNAVLESMSQLRSFVDNFFDSVLVMEKDEAVRRNRLALLTRINGMFSRIADFRKIQTG